MTEVFAYYPGCSLHGASREYDMSLRAVLEVLSQNLKEIPLWLCCGASAAHSINPHLADALAGDTLAKAKATGQNTILAPCAMCYSRLANISYKLRTKPQLATVLAESLHCSATDLTEMRVFSILNWLNSLSAERLTAPQKYRFNSLKFACYYGCLLVRPQKITGVANAEVPQDLERVLKLLGAETVAWDMATECCGAAFSLSDKQVVFRQGRKIIDSARRAGAQALVVGCPMCQTNLDMRQSEFQESSRQIPVLYITQVLGLAYGIEPKKLGLSSHFIATEPVLQALLPYAPDTAR